MIRIQNVYYMLSYAFQALNAQGYKKLAAEEFHNTGDLCAAILAQGLRNQLKRGLGKEYILKTEPLTLLRGKIDLAESIRSNTILRSQLVCSYDDFSENSYMNRIIRSTMDLLLHSDISKIRKKELRKLMVFFADVEPIDLHTVRWNLSYNRNNQTYRMLISICYLVWKGLLQTKADGSVQMMDFLDEQRMCRLYEKFILEYYRKEHPELTAQASQIPWQLDDEERAMLPIMQTDIMLSQGDRVLIIDAKYYEHTTQSRFGQHALHSGNLYQVFTYVKNKEVQLSGRPHTVSGMLLYAKTDEDIYPENVYHMSGNRIEVRTLNLDGDFQMIREQLDGIARTCFGPESA